MTIEEVYANVQQQSVLNLPFVVYRKANSNLLNAFLQEDDQLYQTKEFLNSGFVFAPFNTDHITVLIPTAQSTQYHVTIAEQAETYNQQKQAQKNTLVTSVDSKIKENHMQLVTKAIQAIDSGKLQKVVVSRKEESIDVKMNCLSLFQKLIRTHPDAFVYYWHHPKIGTWLGATPETLLQIEGDQFCTMALAGTQAYQGNIDPEWGVKEKVEQTIVTNFVISKLESVSNQIHRSKTYTHKAGTLLHLRTDITGRLSTNCSNIQEVIQKLHPTPAVCGLPKKEAKYFIKEHENYDRKYYTGFLGELNQNDNGKIKSDLFVNLRCMEVIEDKVMMYIGGGITKDSDPEKEWQETVKKTETIKKIL